MFGSDSEKTNVHRQSMSDVFNHAQLALFKAGIQDPINGVTQLANHCLGLDLPEMDEFTDVSLEGSMGDHIGRMVGSAAGKAVPFFFCGKLADEGFKAAGMAEKLSGTLGLMARSASAGFMSDAVFRPVNLDSDNFWGQRFANATVTGITLGAFGGSVGGLKGVLGLSSSGREAAQSALGEIFVHTGAGFPAGIVGAQARSFLTTGKVADWNKSVDSGIRFMFTGTALGEFKNLPVEIREF